MRRENNDRLECTTSTSHNSNARAEMGEEENGEPEGQLIKIDTEAGERQWTAQYSGR